MNRSPEELQLFSDMDVTAPPPEPLAASEVPDWVTRAASPIVVSDHEVSHHLVLTTFYLTSARAAVLCLHRCILGGLLTCQANFRQTSGKL